MDQIAQSKQFDWCIIGIDPGGTTGIAIFDNLELSKLEFKNSSEAMEFIRFKLSNTFREKRVIIAYERWITGVRSSKNSRQNDASNVIGFLKSLENPPKVNVIAQNAADAKNLCSDALLKKLGWHTTKMPHANDAARHVAMGILKLNPSFWYDFVTA